VNQVQDVYNGYGQLITQYQEHGGAVNTASSAKVQYGYSQPTGANYSRLSSETYPNGGCWITSTTAAWIRTSAG